MAYKPRDPTRHNPGADPSLANPGWSPPGRRAAPSPPLTPAETQSRIDRLLSEAARIQSNADEFTRDAERLTPAREKVAAMWERNAANMRAEAAALDVGPLGHDLSDLQREYLSAREAYRRANAALEGATLFTPEHLSALDAHDHVARRFYSLAEQLSGKEMLAARRATGAPDLTSPVDTGDVLPDIVIEEALDELAPEADPVPSRRPEGSEAAYRHGPSKERGFVGNMGPAPSPEVQAGILNPRQAAAKTALKGIGGGALGLGTDWMMAYSEGARDTDDWMSQEEENITQMIPGLVSPSELPPPAVLSDERRQAVTATQGMAGVGPDFESAPVTEQEIRAFVGNRMASGRPLPPWAEAITSRGPDGRVRIEPRVLRRPPQRPVAPPPAAPQQSSVPMELRRR